MQPLTLEALWMLGCLGGFLVEALKHIRKLQQRERPDGFAISASVGMVLVGGAVAAVYVNQVQSTLIAVQLGPTAPAIIGAWASGGPPPPRGGGPRGGGGGTIAVDQVDVVTRVLESLRWNVSRP